MTHIHIQIDDITPTVTYTVGGTPTDTFIIPFAFFQDEDIVVEVDDVALTLAADYTVTGTTGFAGGYPGGTVTLDTAVTNVSVTVRRDVPIKRTTDFLESGPFSKTELNTQLDKIVAMVQQVDSQLVDQDAIDAQFDALITLVGSLTPGTIQMFASRTALGLATITGAGTTVTWVYVDGFAAAGDGGRGFYKYVATPSPVQPWHKQSADGAYWQLNVQGRVHSKQLGAKCDNSTNDTAANQAVIDYCGEFGVEGWFDTGTSKTTPLTVADDNVTLHLPKGAILDYTSVGTGNCAISVEADNFEISGRGKIDGPTGASYVTMENGIECIGTSTAARRSGLIIRGIEITGFGAHGVYTQFCDDIEISRAHIHDCAYAGAMHLSTASVLWLANKIHDITPGTSSNMYGLSATHDSTGYSADVNKNTKQATHPFSQGVVAAFNEIYNIAWEGIDFHGGYENIIIANKIYATKHGIGVTEGSGDADNYAGWANIIALNHIDGRDRDGTSSGYENLSYGINVNGGSATSENPRTIVLGNTIRCKGIPSNINVGSIQATFARRVIIAENTIDLWNGVAILVTLTGGIINANFFGGTNAGGDTAKYCISDEGPTTQRLNVSNNVHDNSDGGAAASIGFRQASGATVRPMLNGNHFSLATTPFSLSTHGFCIGSDVGPIFIESGGDNTVAIGEMQGNDCAVLLVAGGAYNITTWTGIVSGQTVKVIQGGGGTATLTRDMCFLSGGSNQGLGPSDSLSLTFYNGLGYQTAGTLANA